MRCGCKEQPHPYPSPLPTPLPLLLLTTRAAQESSSYVAVASGRHFGQRGMRIPERAPRVLRVLRSAKLGPTVPGHVVPRERCA